MSGLYRALAWYIYINRPKAARVLEENLYTNLYFSKSVIGGTYTPSSGAQVRK